jgi:AmmeMemoRadiSam system protein B
MPATASPPIAGLFYPEDADELRHVIHRHLSAAQAVGPAPKAVIVPHAAYAYSAAVAACAYKLLSLDRGVIRQVVLIGPSHFAPFEGLATTRQAAFVTPLGPAPIDRDAVMMLSALPGIHAVDHIHAVEHSLQVQLPFLQATLEQFTVVPLAVGDAAPSTVGSVLDRLWDGRQTRIVVSSDLSHYHDEESTRRLDRDTSHRIEMRQPAIPHARACGASAINGLLWVARRRRLRLKTLALRTSADATGDRDRVVGYGAYACYEAGDEEGSGG